MILTAKQEEGLKIAVARYKAHEAYTCIAGYAGSGKSTLITFIIDALGLDRKTVAYATFTGKAAQVLKQKGCPNPITTHKLLYKATPMPNGTYLFTPKDVLDEEYSLIVVDEISMLPKNMWELLLKHGVPIIACGDPGQLPPISRDDDNHVLDHPHVFLDEIMRQAMDSEIIRFSMWVREGRPIAQFPAKNEQVMLIKPEEVTIGMYNWADQVLCATNKTRQDINNVIRQSRGFGPEPQIGDKVISLKNHWDFFSNKKSPLTNGTIGTIQNLNKSYIVAPFWISKTTIPVINANILMDEDEDLFNGICMDYTALKTGKMFLNEQQIYKLDRAKGYPDSPFEFAYAYAITCHKSQGSEWNRVVVCEEYFPTVIEEHKRWVYTAATRASEKLVFVTKN
jgi:exodeoxyribonuclease-5